MCLPIQSFFLERAYVNCVFSFLHWFNSLTRFYGFWGVKFGISSCSRRVPFKGCELKVNATFLMPLMGYFLKSMSQSLRSCRLTSRIAYCFWIHSVFCICLSSTKIFRSFLILSIFIFILSRSMVWTCWPALATAPAKRTGLALKNTGTFLGLGGFV